MKTDMEPSDDIVFYEEQRPWRGFVALGIVSFATVAAIFAYAIITQLILHKPFGDQPMSDKALAIVGPVAVVLGVAGMIATCKVRLVIEVRPDGLYVQYVPIHRRPKKIELDRVESVMADSYWPILEFGGWGICGSTGLLRAYTARGRRGVRIIYTASRYAMSPQVLLGSQRAEELAEAIRWLWQGRPRKAGGGVQ